MYVISMFSKKIDEGDTKMERGHDYVDYDSPPQVCGKFFVFGCAYILLM